MIIYICKYDSEYIIPIMLQIPLATVPGVIGTRDALISAAPSSD